MKYFYNSIKTESESLIKDKGSKFIGLAFPCKNVIQIKSKLEEWKNLHPKATHLCYAYQLGVNEVKFRANDDGEPTNSAGMPILGQIQSFEITNVLVGVIRYYGGTKLGVGGLISAYRQAAKEAIEANKIIEKELSSEIHLSFTYEDMPFGMNIIKEFECEINQQNFELNCQIEILIPNSKKDNFLERIRSLESLKITKQKIEK
jgi:uncharacterized YigZ family protein